MGGQFKFERKFIIVTFGKLNLYKFFLKNVPLWNIKTHKSHKLETFSTSAISNNHKRCFEFVKPSIDSNNFFIISHFSHLTNLYVLFITINNIQLIDWNIAVNHYFKSTIDLKLFVFFYLAVCFEVIKIRRIFWWFLDYNSVEDSEMMFFTEL